MKIIFRLLIFVFVLNSANCYSQSISSIRVDGTVLLNGQPFFPIGIYVVSWNLTAEKKLEYLQDIANAGYNMIHIGGDTSPQFKYFMDQAQALGIFVMIEGINFSSPTAFINKYKTHPALLGWNIGDDAHDSNTTAQLLAKHNAIKALDPDHITYAAMYNFNIWTPYLNIPDAVGPYVYPLPENRAYLNITTKIYNVNKYADFARTNITTSRSHWGVTQAMDFPNDGNVAPNPMEYRNMAYQYMLNNTKAIMPYTYFDQFGHLPTTHPALFAEMKLVNAELDSLSVAFTKGVWSKIVTGTDMSAHGLWVSTWTYDSDTYIVALNTDPVTARSLSASVTLPLSAAGTLRPLFANRSTGLTFSMSNRRLFGAIQPLDVQIYKISSKPTGVQSIKESLPANIFPNPSNGSFTVTAEVPNGEALYLEITNLLGQTIFADTKNNFVGSYSKKINIEDKKSGIYLLRLASGNKTFTQKVIVK